MSALKKMTNCLETKTHKNQSYMVTFSDQVRRVPSAANVTKSDESGVMRNPKVCETSMRKCYQKM